GRGHGEIVAGREGYANRPVVGVEYGALRAARNRQTAGFDSPVLGLGVERRCGDGVEHDAPVRRLQADAIATNARRVYRTVVALRNDVAADVGQRNATVLRRYRDVAGQTGDVCTRTPCDGEMRAARNFDFDAPFGRSKDLEVHAAVTRTSDRNAVVGT